jgi:hypothetical protein
MGLRVAEETKACRIRRKRGEGRRERADRAVFVFFRRGLCVDDFFFGAAFAAGARGPEALDGDERGTSLFGMAWGMAWGLAWGVNGELGVEPAVCAPNPTAHIRNNTNSSRIVLGKCPTATMYH